MGILHHLSRLFRSHHPRGKKSRPTNKKPPVRLWLEQLEDRTVPTAFNLGTLTSGAVFPESPLVYDTNTYRFTISEPAVVDIQALDKSQSAVIGQAPAPGNVAITLSTASNSAVLASSALPDENESIHLSLSPDTYIITVTNQTPVVLGFPFQSPYDLAIGLDLAGDERVLQNGTLIGFNDNSGRDLGNLTETPGTDSAHDFAGYFFLTVSTPLPAPDLTDVYLFTVPATGHVTLSVNGLDPSSVFPGNIDFTATLLRDTDHDGVFSLISSSENLASGEMLEPTDKFVFDGNLNPGRYALAVFEDVQLRSGSNYNLNINYDVPDDSAGDTFATARDLGSAGTPQIPTSAINYLSSVDAVDTFKFNVSGGGPFIVNSTLSNMLPGTDFDIDLIHDKNGNGKVDFGEILASGTNAIGNEEISADTLVGGTFYLRVLRISGEGPYTVAVSSSNLDHGGNTLPSATTAIRNPFFGRVHLADFVSKLDSADIYKVTIANAGTITAAFGPTALNTDADLELIQDINGNGIVDVANNEILDSSTGRLNLGESVSRAVAVGTYYVRVLQVAGTPAYHMTITLDVVGNTLKTARSMGLSGDAAGTSEFIGPGDAADFYKVSIDSPLQLNVFFPGFSEPFTVAIGRDANANFVVDPGETLLTKTIATADDVRQTVNIPGSGVCFVAVTSAGTLGTEYGIIFAKAPTDNAGNTPAAARNVGVLGATRTFSDFVGDGSMDTNAGGVAILGADDVDDYYRFTLGSAGPYKFTGQISGLSGSADIQLIRDDNLNQKVDVDQDEVLATSSNSGMSNDKIGLTLNKPGTYYLRVFRPGSGTTGTADYTLTMSADSTDTADNTLAAAKALGPLTTGNTLSANEFVGAIDLDDFYSFTVPGAGILTVNRDTSVAGIGIEVVNAKGVLLATSGGKQTAAGLIKVSAMLPGADTYFVRALTNGINANYSLSLSFANPAAGTFALTPRETTVHAEQHARLGLDWTVPQGSWHTLNTVDLRLRDRFGTVALIRFHEANNTVSLFDPVTGTFGPARAVGSPGFLENSFVKIFLNTSSVKAASPASSTVSITFDIQFKAPAYDRSFIIEAAASDDLGQLQDFAFAGTLDVLGRRRQP